LGLPPYQRPRALSMEALSPSDTLSRPLAKDREAGNRDKRRGLLRARARIKAPLRFPRQIPVN
jgi:hypothetical protein